MNSEELKKRTKYFALSVMKLVDSLPRGKSVDVVGKQLLRSATSVGANYRAACRARSRADFVSKITIVEEEADESVYWLELLSSVIAHDHVEIAPLIKEANELTAIFTASGKTAKTSRMNPRSIIRNRQSAIRN